jgi:hydroxypyruvate isomerase
MPKFAANLTTMFREVDFRDRFNLAHQCGFEVVEILNPYDLSIDELRKLLDASSLQMILLNISPGEAGEAGTAALPGRETFFRASFEQSLHYASELGAGMIHVLAGRDTKTQAVSKDLFLENIRWAADLAAAKNINLLLEPLNSQDVPNYLHSTSDQTVTLIDQIDRQNVKLQFDFYHLQIMEGNLAAGLKRHFDHIGHVQFSSVPGRHEPQYGEVNVSFLANYLDEIGYTGYIGCEYTAKDNTLPGLTWASDYGITGELNA